MTRGRFWLLLLALALLLIGFLGCAGPTEPPAPETTCRPVPWVAGTDTTWGEVCITTSGW